MAEPAKHTLFEDAQGIAYGATMAAFGIVILTHLGLVTGQTAGLAVLIAYATGWSFGPVFFLINIPFYIAGYLRMGWVFTVKTFVAVALLSGLSIWMPQHLSFASLDPILGAVLFGCVSGSALLALFRHGASLGGVGIVALILQERLGWRAGWVQLGFDAALFAAAFALRDATTVAISFLGAVVVNLIIAINHRRDRYIAT
ncbi:YitT family protein [Xinfangfangia pollutisoli]|uniref:YitT family protein n=1 Tax=Xinfangfangia pollutisoli TaxID=2865960 RepID=UPI001CD1987A|nr:YitT family protein [Xinfangfangia pollutisoli]